MLQLESTHGFEQGDRIYDPTLVLLEKYVETAPGYAWQLRFAFGKKWIEICQRLNLTLVANLPGAAADQEGVRGVRR